MAGRHHSNYQKRAPKGHPVGGQWEDEGKGDKVEEAARKGAGLKPKPLTGEAKVEKAIDMCLEFGPDVNDFHDDPDSYEEDLEAFIEDVLIAEWGWKLSKKEQKTVWYRVLEELEADGEEEEE